MFESAKSGNLNDKLFRIFQYFYGMKNLLYINFDKVISSFKLSQNLFNKINEISIFLGDDI